MLYFELFNEEIRRKNLESPESEEYKKKSDEDFEKMLKKAQEEGLKRQPQTMDKFKTLIEKLQENKAKLDEVKKK